MSILNWIRRLAAEKEPRPETFPQIAEVPCNDGFSIIVRREEDFVEMNGKKCAARYYSLMLKLPETIKPKEWVEEHGGNTSMILRDGAILLSNMLGEAMVVGDALDGLKEVLNENGVAMNIDNLYKIILEDAHIDFPTEPPAPAKKTNWAVDVRTKSGERKLG